MIRKAIGYCLLAGVWLLGMPAPALTAGNGFVDANDNAFDGNAIMCPTGATLGGKLVVAPCGGPTNPLSVAGVVNGLTAITPSDSGTFTNSNKCVQFVVTTTGDIKVGFPSPSSVASVTYPFNTAGIYQYNWGINQVFVTGSTATFTAYTCQ